MLVEAHIRQSIRENKMRNIFKSFVVVLALSGASLFGTATAHADSVGISLNFGDVAIGYSDGYWDHHHHWHRWRNSKYRHAYQHWDRAEYHSSRHTHFSNNGWHEGEYRHYDHHDHHDDQYEHH